MRDRNIQKSTCIEDVGGFLCFFVLQFMLEMVELVVYIGEGFIVGGGGGMSLFDKVKRTPKQAAFSNWLDKHLAKNFPDGVIAINFNLYEGVDQTYDVEIVGCGSFDENDEDWACDVVFTTGDDLFYIAKTDDVAKWEQALLFVAALVKKYLVEGTYADKLKRYKAVGAGFVDGNIEILYRAE